jgi:hypothetical protein
MESLGIFPEPGVVFLAPRMSYALFSIHRAVIHALDERGKPPIADERLLPDLWMPHCTLTGGLTPSQLVTAIEVCQQSWTPIRGQVEGIGMRIFPAPIDHHCYSFSHG